MAKIRLEDIQKELSADGWKVISTEYVNLDTEMTFECPEGHRVFVPWKKLRAKHECPVCKQATFQQTDKIVPKPKGATRIFALDQATKVTGYSIFDNGTLVKYGTFSTSSDDDIERFAMIRAWLLSMIASWHPDYIGIDFLSFKHFSASPAGLIKY